MSDLKITIIQSNLHWENKEENLRMFSEKIAAIEAETDLIILPEMFTTGFSMQPEKFAEEMNGRTVSWMMQNAKEKECVITGSFMCSEDGKYFNRLLWVKSDGTMNHYDKHHLFSMGEENDHYSNGNKKIIEEIKGWKICPLICYDLRFPVWSRNKVQSSKFESSKFRSSFENNAYDLLIYVANWPERRSHPWKTLLLARAIENQCYVAGVNRIGNDGNEIYHSGDSAVVNARGEIISKIKADEESTTTVTLKYSDLQKFRKAFPVWKDADDFEIRS
jgi:predicted amidohydrolase